MGQALYRKYRSKTLGEIVGQEHVTETLSNALRAGRISHAYLLTGPRGVGKTSIARILAHEINGLPYTYDAPLDIIEIDAASNRRIDEIRDLRDRISTAPSAAKYKVYIIDEVHMLTKEAFNALLKTLEEPPAHVVFILATTEVHKLPETIISRTQHYSFRPIPAEKITAHLKTIAKQEKIIIDDDALALIAQHGDGSLRDSTSLLDQASNTGSQVTKADIERILGLAPTEYITSLLTAVEQQQSADIITNISALYSSGYEAAMIAAQLGGALRDAVVNVTLEGKITSLQAITLLKQLLDVPAARQPKQLLELVLLQASLATTPIQPATVLPQNNRSVTPKPTTIITPETPKEIARTVDKPSSLPSPPAMKPQEIIVKPVEQKVAKPPTDAPVLSGSPQPVQTGSLSDVDVRDFWQQTLDDIKKQYNTLYGMARMAVPELEGEKLTLNLKFAFHQKRINEAKNRQILGDAFSRISGHPVEIFSIIADKPLVPASASLSGEPDVAAISNIFGSAELLES